MGREISEYASGFGERRLEDVFAALRKLSPSLESDVRKESGSGPVFERMSRASALLSKAADDLGSGKTGGAVGKEMSASMGKSFSQQNAKALLMAHSQGLSRLASPEGLGGAIFLHHASAFRARLEKAAHGKADPSVRAAALSLVDAWVRSLLMQSSPDDPDDPILALASCTDEADAERWAGKLYLRCVQLTEDERVIDLIIRSFRSKD